MKNLAIGIGLCFGLIFIGYYIFSPSLDDQSARFKQGTFTYTKKSPIKIVRTKDYQVEFSMENDFVDSFNIHWVNPHSYYLTLRNTNKPQDLNFSTTDTMWVEITKVNGSTYYYNATSENKTFEGQLIQTSKQY